ncbi:hypothetical protein BC940DRAFT_332450 [Gongronella butleri]|nr:hypothetical protein BC940DRAFT_332450 [Gongronella butleri]
MTNNHEPATPHAPQSPQSPVASSTAPSTAANTANTVTTSALATATPTTTLVASTSTSSSTLYCQSCRQLLEGEFIRALDGAFHWHCFVCMDCHEPVASKFFPIEMMDGLQQPLCERDYFRRLNLVCDQCGDALKGPYITAVGKKFHLDHFCCTTCGEVFGADDPYYEHNDSVYCYYHYSIMYAICCAGCRTAILKQFVEVQRNNVDEHWHPECYMIHKYWNVKVAKSKNQLDPPSNDASQLTASELKATQTAMEDKVYRIWTVLSAFEGKSTCPCALLHSSAACISAMLMHVSEQSYTEILRKADYFVLHVRVLFNAIDALAIQYTQVTSKTLPYGWEAAQLYKQVNSFFHLVSQAQINAKRGIGFTDDLLSLITGLAQYLKSLIRLGLTAALDLDHLHDAKAVSQFLSQLVKLANNRLQNDLASYTATASLCHTCQQICDAHCFQFNSYRWHDACFACNQCCTPLADSYATALVDEKLNLYCQHCGDAKTMAAGIASVSQLQQLGLLLFGALKQLYLALEEDDATALSKPALMGAEPFKAPASPPKKPTINTKPLEAKTDDHDINLGDIKRTKSVHVNRNDASRRIAKRSTLMETPSPTSAFLTSNQLASSPVSANFDAKQLPLSSPAPTTLPAGAVATPAAGGAGVAADSASIASVTPKQQAPLLRPHRPSQEYVKAIPKAKFYYFAELGVLDHYILKHIAVLYLHEMLKDHSSLEDLTELIDDKKNSSLWGKFVTSLKTTGNKKAPSKEGGTFGVPLEVLVDKNGVESSLGASPTRLRIPCLIDDVVSILKQGDVCVEGIFRKNGNIRQLKDLCEEIDKYGNDVNLASENSIQLAALIKKFLRELPEPLMTFKLYKVFTLIARMPKESDRIRAMHLACCLLPKPNRDTMEVLFLFIKWVSSFAHLENDAGNKMDLNNMATMIAPNLLYPKSKDAAKDESIYVICAIYVLLQHQEEFATVPEDFVPLLETISYGEVDMDLNVRQLLKKCEMAMKKTRASTNPSMMTASMSPVGNNNSSSNNMDPLPPLPTLASPNATSSSAPATPHPSTHATDPMADVHATAMAVAEASKAIASLSLQQQQQQQNEENNDAAAAAAATSNDADTSLASSASSPLPPRQPLLRTQSSSVVLDTKPAVAAPPLPPPPATPSKPHDNHHAEPDASPSSPAPTSPAPAPAPASAPASSSLTV